MNLCFKTLNMCPIRQVVKKLAVKEWNDSGFKLNISLCKALNPNQILVSFHQHNDDK